MSNSYQSTTLPVSSTYVGTLHRFGSGHDFDILGIVVDRCTVASQMVFVRKTFLITLGQLLFTFGLTTAFTHISPIFDWLQNSKYAWWVPLVPMFLVCVTVAWQLWMQFFQLSPTSQITMLCLFSFLMGVILSDIVSKLCYTQGILVMLMIAAGLVGILLYTFQTYYVFSGPKPILASCIAICIASPFLRLWFSMDALEILWPMLLAAIVCGYLVLNLYSVMGNVTTDDSIFANMSFFIDIAYPMRCLHNLCELTDDVDVLPSILHPGPD